MPIDMTDNADNTYDKELLRKKYLAEGFFNFCL